jgi:lysosomal alpha-mannosidase
MLHRRMIYYESVSLAEALNETAFGKGLVVRGKHVLILETPNNK